MISFPGKIDILECNYNIIWTANVDMLLIGRFCRQAGGGGGCMGIWPGVLDIPEV